MQDRAVRGRGLGSDAEEALQEEGSGHVEEAEKAQDCSFQVKKDTIYE